MSSASVLLKAAKGCLLLSHWTRAPPHSANMPWQPRSPCGACEASDRRVELHQLIGWLPLICQTALVGQDKLPGLLQVAQQVASPAPETFFGALCHPTAQGRYGEGQVRSGSTTQTKGVSPSKLLAPAKHPQGSMLSSTSGAMSIFGSGTWRPGTGPCRSRSSRAKSG